MANDAQVRPKLWWVAACVLASGCSTTEPEVPTAVRARPPMNYGKTIRSYFDLKIKGPQKNRVLNIGKPEAGGCPVGGRLSSERGWVVPVQYSTRSGTPGKKSGIEVRAKEYYFWFRQDTIDGVPPTMELCP